MAILLIWSVLLGAVLGRFFKVLVSSPGERVRSRRGPRQIR